MIRRVPVRDATTTNQQALLEGAPTDLLPQTNSVFVDRKGNTYDPHQDKVPLAQLPAEGVLELPRTTWW